MKGATLQRCLINKYYFHPRVESVDKQMSNMGQTNFCACESGKMALLVYTYTMVC